MKSVFVSIFLFICPLELSHGVKIISIVGSPYKSHHNVLERLVIELANKGHEVTLITPFKQSKLVPNLKEVIIPNLHETIISALNLNNGNTTSNSFQTNTLTKWIIPFIPWLMGSTITELFISLPETQRLIKSDERFDLILCETFFAESLLAGFSRKWEAPIVGISSFMPNLYTTYLVGNPAPAAYVPDTFLGHYNHMNFWERLTNTVYGFLTELVFRLIFLPKQDAIMRKYFGNDLPPLDDIIKNTSLVLVNHHFSLAFPRPYLPNMVEIGGYHVYPPKPLPEDLQKYFDESNEGVILFSMGTMTKSSDLSDEKKEGILKAFSRLKQNVLWKFEDNTLTGVPKNVKIVKWVPQSDILAHPNLRLFITHGGMLSTTEATMRGIPMVGIPVTADQHVNMRYTTAAGLGLTLALGDVDENNLYEAVMEVSNNPKYQENAKRVSDLIQDRPLSPIDTAVYWIEYVIRHKGAPHLRSAAQDLAWYQLYLLDVLGFIFITFSLFIFISFYITKFIAKRTLKLFFKKNVKVVKQKKVH